MEVTLKRSLITRRKFFKWAVGTVSMLSSSKFGLSDGTIWAWGLNTSGQLGIGDLVVRSSPTQIGSLTDWNINSLNNQNGYAAYSGGAIKT